MDEKKTKIDCHLTTCGTEKANAKVVEDLTIPDPEPAVGEKIIKEAIEKEEIEDDDK